MGPQAPPPQRVRQNSRRARRAGLVVASPSLVVAYGCRGYSGVSVRRLFARVRARVQGYVMVATGGGMFGVRAGC
eukprot:906866-Pyramimonas_sp.AAC.1